jgi:hypothetical protein
MKLRRFMNLTFAIGVSLICMSALTYAQVQPNWRVNTISFADFATRMSGSVQNSITGMPFYQGSQSQNAAFSPLDFRYTADNVPAAPITTQPTSRVGFWASWTIDLNDDNVWLFVIPPASLDSEFLRRNEISKCSMHPIDSGQPAFGSASCNSSGSSGSRGDSSLGGARYVGYAAVAVLRACGTIKVNTQLTTHSPREAGLDPRQDAVNESRALASKYAKDIMVNLINAFDPVCSSVRGPSPQQTPMPTPTPIVRQTPVPTPTPNPDQGGQLSMRKLHLYYNDQHHDSLTIASDDAMRAAATAGYRYIGEAGGYVFVGQPMGTIPLSLWYNSSYGDYFTSTTTDTAGMARLNYQFVRVEGYVYPSQQPNSVPLKNFWAPSRSDYFATATSAGETGALNSGYSFVRIEGYLPSASAVNSGACGLGVRWDETEDGWSGQWMRRGMSSVFDSIWVSPTGQRAGAIMSISIAGSQVTIRRDQAGVGTCNYSGQIAADGINVSGGYTCSWWPNGGTNPWRAVIRCN